MSTIDSPLRRVIIAAHPLPHTEPLASPIAKLRLTNENDVELETTLQEFMLDLLRDRVETDIGLGTDFFSHFRAVIVETKFHIAWQVEERVIVQAFRGPLLN